MKRESLIWMIALLGVLHSYLLSNPFGAILGLILTIYLIHHRVNFHPDVVIERNLRGNFEEGKESSIEYFVENRGSEIKLKIVEEGLRAEKLVERLREGERKVLLQKVFPEAKGEFPLRTRIKALSPNELYFREIALEPEKIHVIPSLESIKEGMERRVRSRSLLTRGFSGLQSLEFDELREYLPGDDMKRIDWKASSRLNELIVREFLREEARDVYIILDMTREMRKMIRRAKIDYAVTLLLYLASALLKSGIRVGVIGYSEKRFIFIPPSGEREQIQRIRSEIRFMREAGFLSLKPSLSSLSQRTKAFLRKIRGDEFERVILSLRSPSTLVIITDLMSYTSRIFNLISRIGEKHRIIILSPNPVLFYSGEMNEEVLRKLYESYIERERVLKKFRRRALVLDLGPEDYEEVLREVEI